MAGQIVVILSLLLVGCASTTKYPIAVNYCDPRERVDCWAVTEEAVQAYFDQQVALQECQKRL